MFEDYYFDDPALQDALAAAGYYAEPARTAAVMPSTIQAAEPIMGIGSPAVAAPAAAPSVIETAAAPMSYEALADRRAAANALPQGTYLAAPTDNLGKATGYDIAGQGSNLFSYRGGPVQVTDRKGNVLFSGEGPEAAVDAARFAQNLSDTKGKNASWDIQQGERTINPDGSVGPIRWVSGPTDSKEGMGTVGDLIAFVAPIAAAIATAGMSIPAQIAIAAAVGGISAVVAGNDPLKGAVVSGITAGLSSAGGEYAGLALEKGGTLGTNLTPALARAVGTGAGATTAGLVTGQNLENALLSGAASGTMSYYGPAIQRGIGAVGDAVGGAFDGINVIGSGTSGGVRIGGGGGNTSREVSGTESPGTIVTAGNTPGIGIGSGITRVDVPASTVATEPPAEENPPGTIVTATPPITPPVIGIGGTTTQTPAEGDPGQPGTIVTATPPITPPVVGIGGTTTPPPAEGDPGEPGTIVTATPPITPPVVGIGGGTTTPPPPPPPPPPPAEGDPGEPGTIVTATPPITPPPLVPGGTPPPPPPPSPPPPPPPPPSIIDIIKTVVPLIPLITPPPPPPPPRPPGPPTPPLIPGVPLVPVPGTGIGRYPYTPTTYGRVGGDQETEYVFFTRDPVTGAGTSVPAAVTTPVAPAAISSGTAQQAPTTTMTPASPATTPSTSTRIPSVILTAEGYKPNPAYTADVAMQRYRAELPNNNYYSPQERQQIMSSIENAYAQPGATGEQVSNAYQNASASATRARDLQAAPAVPMKDGGEIDDDMVKHLVDYHKNGGHQGPGQVKGIGSGQEDKIPAYLSDGEYVWSAQDVSDLGDGSNREGVRRLDEMRKMVRQQAGRKDVKKIAKPQKGIDRMLKAVGGLA